MGKIGTFDYPDYKISDAIEVARVIEERFNGRVENQATLAEVLGHTNERSGGYVAKITALRRYGLVTGRGELSTTQVAKSIIFPKSPEERTSAIAQAMENVELFKRVFERLAGSTPTDDFWVDLVEITGEERGIAQKDAIRIRNLFMSGYEYLVSARKPEKPKPEEKKLPAPVDALFELRTREYGTLIARDEESIIVARKLIDLIEEKVKGKKKKEKAETRA